MLIFGLLGCITLNFVQGAEKPSGSSLGILGFSSFQKDFAPTLNPGMRALMSTPYKPSAHFNRPATLLAICAPTPHEEPTIIPEPIPTRSEQLVRPASPLLPAHEEPVAVSSFSTPSGIPKELSTKTGAAATQQPETPFQEERYELIPEQFSTIGSIVSKTLRTLNSKQINKSEIDELQESWTTLGSFEKLSYDSFTSNLKNNFGRKITPLLNENYAKAPSCLGFFDHNSLSCTAAQEKFTSLTGALDLLKNLNKNPKTDGEITEAMAIIKTCVQQACDADFVKKELFSNLGSLENVTLFIEATEPFFGIIRQTYFLLREPLGLDIFKSYCQGKEALEEKVKDYQQTLEHYQINPRLTGTVMGALVYKKAAGELEDKAEILAALQGCLQ